MLNACRGSAITALHVKNHHLFRYSFPILQPPFVLCTRASIKRSYTGDNSCKSREGEKDLIQINITRRRDLRYGSPRADLRHIEISLTMTLDNASFEFQASFTPDKFHLKQAEDILDRKGQDRRFDYPEMPCALGKRQSCR